MNRGAKQATQRVVIAFYYLAGKLHFFLHIYPRIILN